MRGLRGGVKKRLKKENKIIKNRGEKQTF